MLEFWRGYSDAGPRPQPFLISSQLLRARKALERILASGEPGKTAFLRQCYGPISFKCSVVGCPQYDIGFEELQERDNHVKSHSRPFKCPEHGCFYEEVGFANNQSLNKHTSQCHTDSASDKFIFPRLRSYPTKDEQQRFREAIAIDNLDLVRDLAQKYSSLLDEVRPSGGRTALQHAARYGKVRIAQFLLQSRSNIGVVNASGSALSVACLWGQTDMVRFLLSNSRCEEDVNSKNAHGVTPLHAIASGIRVPSAQLPILRLLLDDSRVFTNSQDRNGRTPLSCAAGRWAGSSAAPVVKMLLEHHEIDADARDNEGRTPLSWATAWGSEEVVRMFLQCGKVDVNAKDNKGRTPLLWAASRFESPEKAQVVKALTERGASGGL